jgi:WD40 repeat protein
MASVDLQEKANFTRLSRLLVDKGTEALRNTFDAIHPPANLPVVLNANRTSLLRLKPRVIYNSQWDLLFPPSGNPPDSKTFDVTLLTVLFRNICGLPSTGWGAMPPDTDRSMQANIVRLKFLRNEIYAHVTSTQVDNATFESLWQKISQGLVELKIPQNDVDDLKTSPLGPEEEEYVKILNKWKSQEEECIKVLEAIECSINRLTQITEENRDGIKRLHQSVLEKDLQCSITCPSQASKDTNLERNCSKKSDEDLLRKLAKLNFKSKIKRKVELFHPGTRRWLLKRVDEFVGNEQKSRMLLLTAGPGFGKSVFAADVCEEFKKKGKLAACHFCDFSNPILRDPMTMLQSLASQMCENIAGFKEKLLDQLKRPHPEVRSLKSAFTIFLQNPLDELELEEPSLVVIDGLDESEADDKNEIVNLIADYFSDLPECIKVLVTSRPVISVAKVSGVQKIDIAIGDTDNKSDLRLYLKASLPSLEDSMFYALAKKCEGSFLYAFYIQFELGKRDDLDKMTLDEIINFLPKALDSVYMKYVKRLEDELKAIIPENLDVLKILEMLAATEGPLPLTFVTRALGLARDCRETRKIINNVNETISCLLYVSDDMVTVFHKSVVDWLLAEGYKDHEYTVKLSDGNRSLWLICEQIFKDIKKSVCSGHDLNLTNDVKYAVHYGLRHLVACKMRESFFWLVDVVIIHAVLTEHFERWGNRLLSIWVEILQGAVDIDDKLRAQISWHVADIEFLRTLYRPSYQNSFPLYYLQNVVTHSPEGYFNDNEKKIAESLLSKFPRFVEFSFHEMEVMPLSVCHCEPVTNIDMFFSLAKFVMGIGLSYDKTMAAVAQLSGTISTIRVISVPRLVELWSYSTENQSISCCTFAPDSSFVLFGQLETVLDIAERKEVPFFHGNKEKFTSCAFSPNGKRLVTSDRTRTIKLWDVAKRSLLSSLCADVTVNCCSFSSTGLFILGDWIEEQNFIFGVREQDVFCVWNAITWQRSDVRNLPDVMLGKSKLCHRCFRPGFKELDTCRKLAIKPFTLEAGVYNGVECILALDGQLLSVIENTHFSTLAVWNLTDYFRQIHSFKKITAIENNLWFIANEEKLFVFRTLAPTQEQRSPLPRLSRVFSCSFSPDGSRLATCTSDGCINIWNVDTTQVEQRFKSNQGESSFACWWSEEFLFVFDFFDGIPSLSKYPMNINLKILFTQSQQVSLCHLVDQFVCLSGIVDFSEGMLSFECGESVKVLDVSGVGGPRMANLPGIKPGMSVAVSAGASFVFGADEYTYYIWKRNAQEELDVYEVFFTESFERPGTGISLLCCFSNDSKVAVVLDVSGFTVGEIFDLDTGDHKGVKFDIHAGFRLFCLNKDRVVIAASRGFLVFFDMDSGACLDCSFQRHLTRVSPGQLKLSPNETMIACPKINGDMEFFRLCIPQSSVLSSIKREASTKCHRDILGNDEHTG